MDFPLPIGSNAQQLIMKSSSKPNQLAADVPKGYLVVYVGDESRMKTFFVPLSYLNQPSFQEFLCHAEEEFGFDHPKGDLTIPCTKDAFIDLISGLNGC